MSETVTASNGIMLPLSDMTNNFVYSGGFVSTNTVVYRGITYIQTFLNNGTNITSISSFVAQS